MINVGEIILEGKLYQVGAPVLVWHDHKMTWTKQPNVVARVIDPSLIIWHWTAGENSPQGFYGTLNNRGLGITFYVTRGVDEETGEPMKIAPIIQYVDPMIYDPRDTGGGMGRRSISIEIANFGFLPLGKKKKGRGSDRILDRVRIHGQRLDVARFYPQQIIAVAALTKVLCQVLDIPMVFPREADGSIMHREMTNSEKRSFKGIIGHFHKTDKKADPGYYIFDELGYLEAR